MDLSVETHLVTVTAMIIQVKRNSSVEVFILAYTKIIQIADVEERDMNTGPTKTRRIIVQDSPDARDRAEITLWRYVNTVPECMSRYRNINFNIQKSAFYNLCNRANVIFYFL